MAKRKSKGVRVTGKWSEGESIVDISRLLLDKDMQARAKICNEAVDEYAEGMADTESNKPLPPISVVVSDEDAKQGWVVDGWHRVLAALKAGLSELPAVVKFGTRTDAMAAAAAANQQHGVRRTNADKRLSVMLIRRALPDSSVASWAAQCGVTRTFVYNLIQKERDTELAMLDIESVPKQMATPQIVELNAETEASSEEHDPQIALVMKRMAIATRDASTLFELIATIKQKIVIAAAANAAEPDITTFINVQSILCDLEAVKSAIRNASPHSICPVCGGMGCAMCRQRGWVSVQQYKLIPKSQREGVAE